MYDFHRRDLFGYLWNTIIQKFIFVLSSKLRKNFRNIKSLQLFKTQNLNLGLCCCFPLVFFSCLRLSLFLKPGDLNSCPYGQKLGFSFICCFLRLSFLTCFSKLFRVPYFLQFFLKLDSQAFSFHCFLVYHLFFILFLPLWG